MAVILQTTYSNAFSRMKNKFELISLMYDDVIKWKHFPRYWPFVRGIHLSPANSPHKGQWRGASIFFFDRGLTKRLSKQSGRWWFETLSCSLWRNGLTLSVQLIICHHQCRYQFGTEYATCHYLNQWWSCPVMHMCVSRLQCVNKIGMSHV